MSNSSYSKSRKEQIELDAYQVEFVIKAIDEQIKTLEKFNNDTLKSAKILETDGIDMKIKEQIQTYEDWKKYFKEIKKRWA